MNKLDLVGRRFTNLLVIEPTEKRYNGKVVWRCSCDCGGEVLLSTTRLNTGNTKSCGCLKAKGSRTTHGGRKTDEYRIWRHMRSRCENESTPYFKDYGGRGIKVCHRWMDFNAFFSDMGPRPSVNHSIDRIDNNLGYEPGNCRWATAKEQNRNRRDNVLYEFDGIKATLPEHCERHGVKHKTAFMRLSKGATLELALTKGRIPRNTMNVTVQRLMEASRA